MRAADCALTFPGRKPNQPMLSAGWRRGYAADCKSPRNSHEINTLSQDCYQDRQGTPCEPDKGFFPLQAAKNYGPGPLAGASEAEQETRFAGTKYHDRRARANALWEAFLAADPQDAAIIAAAILEAARAGMPDHDPFGGVRADAAFWADCATPHELEAYALAALRVLPDRVISLRACKRTFAALWERFREDDRRAFLIRIARCQGACGVAR